MYMVYGYNFIVVFPEDYACWVNMTGLHALLQKDTPFWNAMLFKQYFMLNGEMYWKTVIGFLNLKELFYISERLQSKPFKMLCLDIVNWKIRTLIIVF